MDLPRYLRERDAIMSQATPGIDAARRLSRSTDEMLAALAEEASSSLSDRVRWALLALGGYGVGALLPASDLDLLVVSNASSATLKPFIEALLYPLWDAGLSVGHQVRSRKEQLRAVREDLATLTATLTGRVIAGDDGLGADVLNACATDARKRSRIVLGELKTRERPGSPYALEPDLKTDAGGRRDYDELTWTAAVLTGAPQGDPGALIASGVLLPQESERLSEAANTVAAARWELQHDGLGSYMTLEAAEEMSNDPQAVQFALADTHNILLDVRDRLAGTDDTDNGQLEPSALLGLTLAGSRSLGTLERAAWAGRFDALVPGFSELLVLRRPGLAHTRTVGAHCLAAACVLGDIAHGGDPDETPFPGGELAHRSVTMVPDMRVPALAAVVHDIGKEIPGPGHAERGAETARAAAKRFGIPEAADDLSELVRLHLLLPETATREDLDDEDAILRTAGRIGDRRLLAPLHLLTVADSMATGPGAWTEWHEALIGKLVTHLDAALREDVDGAGIAVAAEDVRATALQQVPTGSREAAFIKAAPVRYLADKEPVTVVRHAFLVAGLTSDPAPGAHETEIGAGPLPGTFRVTVVARDRDGLFASFAGAFALSGIDILAAQALTVSGIALDTFTVCSATRAEVGTETWARFERTLSAALIDRLAMGVRLAERQRQYRQPNPEPPRVDVDASDPYAAVVTVRARDRLGLLYDVSRAIGDSALSIVGVTATTREDRAVDTFRIVDRDGQIPAEGLLGQIVMRLRELR